MPGSLSGEGVGRRTVTTKMVLKWIEGVVGRILTGVWLARNEGATLLYRYVQQGLNKENCPAPRSTFVRLSTTTLYSHHYYQPKIFIYLKYTSYHKSKFKVPSVGNQDYLN